MTRTFTPGRQQRLPPDLSPNERIRQVTERDYITYSEINAFQRCPLQWHFRYVEQAPVEDVSAAMILGSGVHAAIEAHYQAILSAGVLPPLGELMQVFDACWAKETKDTPVAYPKGQDQAGIRGMAERMIEQFLASEQAVPAGEIIGLEETFRVVLGEDLPDLMGRVDVLTYDGRDLLITDIKTARSMWTAEMARESSDQLVLYSLGMHGLARTLDAAVQIRFVIVTKAKTPKIEAIPVKIDTDRLTRTRLVVRQVVQAMEGKAVYPSPSPINCSTCPFKQRCEAWHRSRVWQSAATRNSP